MASGLTVFFAGGAGGKGLGVVRRVRGGYLAGRRPAFTFTATTRLYFTIYTPFFWVAVAGSGGEGGGGNLGVLPTGFFFFRILG